ncbi:Platelet-activating factor acetylhydrolase [Smittium mucronatum]|uniref:1-alkyl-2-acetylglycerophosphocholine esterase n=1 Tax=Smittium mucronatum TaxID=133383 RepID=A0A1R0H918_9FUNG|nr:Platelet-activating factor acetylhydrolase [Smittium mucronatum]
MNWFNNTMSYLYPRVYNSSGPYDVGVFDYEWSPKDFDYKAAFDSKASKSKSLFADSLYLRCYYPGVKDDSTSNHVDWLPEPKNIYAEGYGSFAKVPTWASRALFGFFGPSFRMPAYFGISPATSLPDSIPNPNLLSQNTLASSPSSDQVANTNGAPANPVSISSEFPVAIFSHGLAGNRTTYSSICRELASHGIVVLALEHRDGSASATYLNSKKTSLPYDDFNAYMANANKALPKNIDGDADDNNIKEFGPERLEFQRKKLESRVSEIYETVSELHRIKADSSSSPPSSDFSKLGLASRLNLDQLVVVGHSFGGSSALEAVNLSSIHKYTQEKNPPFVAAVTIDPWMFPLERENPKIVVPTIVIRSENFLKWDIHYKEEVGFLKKSFNIQGSDHMLTTPGKFYSVNIHKSGHQYFSDLYLLFPWMSKVKYQNYTADPKLVIDLTNQLSIEFLRKFLSADLPAGNSGKTSILDNIKIERPDLSFD